MPSNEQYTDFEDLLSKTSIIEYIEKNWAPLKKSGSNFLTRCPFHDDTNPSMSVNNEKGLYHCFSCKAGGNLITFVKEFKNLSSTEALEEICDFFDIKLRKTNINFEEDVSHKKELYDINKLTSMLFNKCLLESKNTAKIISYLKERGFDKKDVVENNLGFAPKKWDFVSSFLSKKKIQLSYAEKLGLIVKKENDNGYYDFFRNRIIFPIRNRQGIVLGFAGRTVDGDAPKYINSKESEIFSKRKVLYGIDKFTNLRSGKSKYIFVVEGYTDVLMMNQNGIFNVVATMGTALTIEHANEIKKYSDKVIMCYDSDEAGINASFRNIEPLYQLGIDVYILRLDAGHDPCSFIDKYGKEDFLNKAKKSILIIDEYIEYLKDEYIEKNLSINELLRDFVSKIKYIQDRIQLDIVINKFVASFGISKKELERVLNNEVIKSNSGNDDTNVTHLTPEEIILKILIERNGLRNEDILDKVQSLSSSTMFEEIVLFLKGNIQLEASQIINSIDKEESRNYVSSLIFNPFEITNDDKTNAQLIDDCMKKNKIDSIKDKKRRINLKLSKNTALDEGEERRLLQELKTLLDEEKKLKK